MIQIRTYTLLLRASRTVFLDIIYGVLVLVLVISTKYYCMIDSTLARSIPLWVEEGRVDGGRGLEGG